MTYEEVLTLTQRAILGDSDAVAFWSVNQEFVREVLGPEKSLEMIWLLRGVLTKGCWRV